jgi:hypothetical protein
MSTDETQPVSGSRWEPPVQPAYAPAPPSRAGSGRLALAAGAVGIAVVAGTGGFALGHVAAGDDGRDGPGQVGFPNFGPNGGPGTGPGDGQGQPPGFPGDPDDGDGSHGDDGAPRGSSDT